MTVERLESGIWTPFGAYLEHRAHYGHNGRRSDRSERQAFHRQGGWMWLGWQLQTVLVPLILVGAPFAILKSQWRQRSTKPAV
jgi:hypothetical protein